MLQYLRKDISRTLLAFATMLWVGLGGSVVAIAQGPGRDADKPKPDFPGLDIQVEAGWDGRVEVNAPVPISFLLSNQSEQVLEGQLILTDPFTKKEVNLGDVFIGPASVKRFSSVQALTGWSDCVATYTDGDEVYWTRPVPLITGKDFSEDLNFLLFVDDGGRALQLPGSETPASAESVQPNAVQNSPTMSGGMAIDPSRYIPRQGSGRAVQPLSVKTWQIPQHPGPLTVTQGILFSESAKPEMLNEQQWDAIGRWMCLGGTVFLHDSSKEVLDRLKKAAPLTVQPPARWEELSVHRCGGGSIREYSGKLFSADDRTTMEIVLAAVGKLSRTNILWVLDETSIGSWSSSNADKTRLMVIVVFAIYMLFSGVITLLLFRMNRRRVAIYTSSVVLIACIAAAVLGGVLRTSRGDLQWHSVTQSGPGGVSQVAEIDVQSAGGRNTGIAVQGKRADLQLLESTDQSDRHHQYDPYYYGYNGYNSSYESSIATGYAAFTTQSNLLPDSPDAFRIRVPITPWGFRKSTATAYDTNLRGLEVKLSYKSDNNAAEQMIYPTGSSVIARGKWTVEVSNQLPFDLTDCRLVLMTCRAEVSVDSPGNFGFGSPALAATPTIRLVPGNANVAIENLPVYASKTSSVETVEFQVSQTTNQGFGMNVANACPRAAYNGSTGAWFLGRASKSPLLSIDDKESDFEPLNEVHYIIQEIYPEQLPEEWIEQHQMWMDLQLKGAEEQLSQLKQSVNSTP